MLPAQREEIDKFARERGRAFVQKQRKEAKPTLGTAEAAQLLDTREVVYRGRAYSVAPIPWPLGSQILGILEDFQRNPTAENHARAAQLAHQVASPVRLAHRIGYKRNNPWTRMTGFEVGRFLGFSYLCHLLDQSGVEPGARKLGTSSQTSRAFVIDIPRGSGKTATRARGATSSTGSGAWRPTNQGPSLT